MGVIGGGLFQAIKGFRNAPSVSIVFFMVSLAEPAICGKKNYIPYFCDPHCCTLTLWLLLRGRETFPEMCMLEIKSNF